jgi:hydroxymethylpyrimidine/phosphomethylpyrimidine kinase
MTPTVVLTIAGSDSSGGAGVQADLRTFAAHGVHGASAFAALTAQNTVGVQGIHAVPAEFVIAQITSVLDDLDVAAVKTGMLATAGSIRAVAQLARSGRLPNLVVDPVMVASTGATLLQPDAERAYVGELIPAARVITPNRSEAAVLVGRDLAAPAEVEVAARQLAATGPELVVVTGGAEPDGPDAVDLVVGSDGSVTELRAPRVSTGNDHGTGCSFASATAARLALGDQPLDALRAAKRFVHRGLLGGAPWRLGAGRGPIDHMGWNASEPHPPWEAA